MFSRKTIAACSVATAAIAGVILAPSAAFAHGYVGTEDRDPSHTSLTARVAMTDNAAGSQYDAPWNTPQGMEAQKGFPAKGPADGKLASAGQPGAGVLDEQTEDRWIKNDVAAGEVDVDWFFTMGHKTTKFEYFMTKPGWDPNDKLERSDFDSTPITVVEHDGSEAGDQQTHTIDIPEDREGYHVIYAVWEVADTDNSFYNVIDVNVDGDAEPEEPDTESPSHISNITAQDLGSGRAQIDWEAATDNVGVDRYVVEVDGQKVSEVHGDITSTVISGLQPETTYSVTVHPFDRAGNTGGSKIVPLTTGPADEHGDTEVPTAPKGLHSMGATDTSIDLMWAKSTDNIAVTEYQVWDLATGAFVASTTSTSATINSLTPGTKHWYVVHAFDAAGNMSASSNIVMESTSDSGESGLFPAWDAFAAYTKGDQVSHDGKNYIAVATHQGVGDPNWITALSLWNEI